MSPRDGTDHPYDREMEVPVLRHHPEYLQMNTLLLTAPYGEGNGDTISLRCPHGPVDGRMEKIMEGYSCHPPALPKIRSCLTHSGRYDCIVEPGWFRHHAGSLEEELEEVGIELKVLSLNEEEWHPPLTRKFRGERPLTGGTA